jgi:hypothetical protein
MFFFRAKKFTQPNFFFFFVGRPRANLFGGRIYCVTACVGGSARTKISLDVPITAAAFLTALQSRPCESHRAARQGKVKLKKRIEKRLFVESNHRYQMIVFRELHLEIRIFFFSLSFFFL